jgi:hypothetical protein
METTVATGHRNFGSDRMQYPQFYATRQREFRRVVRPRQGEKISDRLPLEQPFDVMAEDPALREDMQRALAKVDKIPCKMWRISRRHCTIRGQDAQRQHTAYGKHARAPGRDTIVTEQHDALAEGLAAVPSGTSIGSGLTGQTEAQQRQQLDDDAADAVAAARATVDAAANAAAANAAADVDDDERTTADAPAADATPAHTAAGAAPTHHQPFAAAGIAHRKLTVGQLRKELSDRGLETTGSKQQLLSRFTRAVFEEENAEALAEERRLQARLEEELRVWRAVEDDRIRRGEAPPTGADADAGAAAAAAGAHATAEAAMTTAPAPPPSKPCFAFGAKQLCDAVRLQVVDALHADLVLQDSSASKIGLKVTVDAAFLRESRINECRNLTTVIVQLLCLGVEGQDWGATAVKNMLHGAQAPTRAFKLRCWFGKDDSVNLMEHFIPYIKQALALDEKGLDADLLQLLPPRLMGRNADGAVFIKHLPICWKKGDGNEKARRVRGAAIPTQCLRVCASAPLLLTERQMCVWWLCVTGACTRCASQDVHQGGDRRQDHVRRRWHVHPVRQARPGHRRNGDGAAAAFGDLRDRQQRDVREDRAEDSSRLPLHAEPYSHGQRSR